MTPFLKQLWCWLTTGHMWAVEQVTKGDFDILGLPFWSREVVKEWCIKCGKSKPLTTGKK